MKAWNADVPIEILGRSLFLSNELQSPQRYFIPARPYRRETSKMAAVKEIDPPFTIATLTQPLPIKGTERRILSSGVYSLSGSKKRKRAEVAVSSDGEGIQIYNVSLQHGSKGIST